MSKNTTPRWQNPNKPIPPKIVDPAATPVKAKSGRDYISEALAAVPFRTPGQASLPLDRNRDLIPAIIIAQALDRFGEKLIDAAAVSQYRRTP